MAVLSLVDLLKLYLTFTILGFVCCQEEFLDAVECYECYDRAVNTTCADPTHGEVWEPRKQLDTIPTVKCRKGACVKWAFYRNHELMLHRTCSLKINLNIQYATVCRTEKFGNGYLCMCPDDLCNSSPRLRAPFHLFILALTWLITTS